MAKNSLDHWIKRKFLLTYVVYCNQFPYLPVGAILQSLPEACHWKYRIELPQCGDFYSFAERLKKEGARYEAVEETRHSWWVKFVEPDREASITMVFFWRLVKLGISVGIAILCPLLDAPRYIRMLLLRW